jgi:aminopeptidase N
MRKRMEEQQKLEDTKTDVGWGHQIRSYVLDQSRIKDLRTNVEISHPKSARWRPRSLHRSLTEARRLSCSDLIWKTELVMREGQPTAIHREDYAAPAFWIDTVDLTFDLEPTKTRVLNKMRLRRNPDVAVQPLRLDGEDLNLARVLVNGQGTSFKMDGGQLVLENLPEGPDAFDAGNLHHLRAREKHPADGLVRQPRHLLHAVRSRRLSTHHLFPGPPRCDGQLHRHAARRQGPTRCCCPTATWSSKDRLDDGRHFAKWVDPHKKPSYLFALVAGQLVCREQRITQPQRARTLLQVLCASGRPGQDRTRHELAHGQRGLGRSRFGLPLDLERFMIVATSDFNMGAMENKGLNIFNTKYVLASPATATDIDYGNIESVVGHEYFHNWTGNRITCRDWFQLSSKRA